MIILKYFKLLWAFDNSCSDGFSIKEDLSNTLFKPALTIFIDLLGININ